MPCHMYEYPSLSSMQRMSALEMCVAYVIALIADTFLTQRVDEVQKANFPLRC